MLQQMHSGHSAHSSDDAGGKASRHAGAAAAGQAGTAAEAAACRGGGVVGWTKPEQLAALIQAELRLEG